jgi:hypothetical protein
VFDPTIKYGGGHSDIAAYQLRFSELIQEAELTELPIYVANKVLSRVYRRGDRLSEPDRQALETRLKELALWQDKLDSYKQTIQEALQELMMALDSYRG